MAVFNIDLPVSFDVSSRGETVHIDIASLTPELVAKLALHGLTQKVSDAAAGAKKAATGDDGTEPTDDEVAQAGLALMQKVVDRLVAGEWGIERGTSASADPMDKYRIEYMRQLMRSNPKGKLKVAHDAVEGTAERRAFLLGVAAKNFDKIEPEAILLRDAAREAAKAAEQVKGLDI